MKNYKALVGGKAIRPAVSASGNYGSQGSILPHRLGDRGPIIPDDSISKKLFSGPIRHF